MLISPEDAGMLCTTFCSVLSVAVYTLFQYRAPAKHRSSVTEAGNACCTSRPFLIESVEGGSHQYE
jgi:hypothetical protein